MENLPPTVNTPGVIQTILMLEAIRRADVLEERLALAGQTIQRRQAIVEVLTRLTQDMALCLDVWDKATVAPPG